MSSAAAEWYRPIHPRLRLSNPSGPVKSSFSVARATGGYDVYRLNTPLSLAAPSSHRLGSPSSPELVLTKPSEGARDLAETLRPIGIEPFRPGQRPRKELPRNHGEER